MKVLLTGVTGYIGKRLLPVLVEMGYKVICCVRDAERFTAPKSVEPFLEVIQVDLLNESSLAKIPKDIDGAFYLIHSMSSSKNYDMHARKSACNFREAINNTHARHVVFLGSIVNESSSSKHMTARNNIEIELRKGHYNFTALRANIIIGSGSASFEIIRDLVEKLPVMIAPKWLNTKCQPIDISDVIKYLSKTLFNPKTFNQCFDIGGPDILNYKEMLLGYGKIRNLKRKIIVLPVMMPRLSSYWLYFITSTSYKLASALVDNMKMEAICKGNNLSDILNIEPIGYSETLTKAFSRIESNEIVSSWKDSLISGRLSISISDFIDVPSFGCLTDIRIRKFENCAECKDKIWRIGGANGWYYATWLWRIRGFMDKMVGGVGLRRGRTHESRLEAGNAVDFWRVLYENKKEGRLLLFAEMKLPGEAWLEFRISNDQLIQTATFRPKGLLGRIYWLLVYPFHGFVFRGLINKLTQTTDTKK